MGTNGSFSLRRGRGRTLDACAQGGLCCVRSLFFRDVRQRTGLEAASKGISVCVTQRKINADQTPTGDIVFAPSPPFSFFRIECAKVCASAETNTRNRCADFSQYCKRHAFSEILISERCRALSILI